MALYCKEALAKLRAVMQREGIDYFLLTSSDFHASEYVSDYFKATEYLSGCTSDNVVMIAAADEAWLWTDGRYFISAAAELNGTGVALMKMGEPGVQTVDSFLREKLTAKPGAEAGEGAAKVLAFDGRTVDAKRGAIYRRAAAKAGAKVVGDAALIDEIWTDRPALPSHPVFILPDDLTGKTYQEKLADLREDLKKAEADHLVLMRLDDIMWLLNIRGGDVSYNPVALSYAFISPESCTLFIQESELTPEFRDYAQANAILLRPYEEIFDYLREYKFPEGSRTLCDHAAASDAVVELLKGRTTLINRSNPTVIRKACKNVTEMGHIRDYYLRDSVAVCKFIYWVKQRIAAGGNKESASVAELTAGESGEASAVPFTEMAAARKMDALRAEIPGFLDLSFPTIPAYNANAAMAHYAPEGEGTEIGGSGFLLVDSGGQYLGATTDVTRTIALGGLTEEMKRDFTLVAAGHFRLMNAVFKKGTIGTQLDLIARQPLYEHGLDFNHGTGHGIGYILNVHEGPQGIGPARPGVVSAAMAAGMVTSDEPGVYREGRYGIRTESILLTVPAFETEFGSFLKFDCLTWVPVDRDAIDPAYLSGEDLAILNAYHREVYEKVAPYLTEDERAWLKEATECVNRDVSF